MFGLLPPPDGIFVALELPVAIPIIEPYVVKFKNTEYTVMHSKSISLSMHIASMKEVDTFSSYQMQGFSVPVFSQYFFGSVADKMDKKKRTELLQKLKKTLVECYAAEIPFEDIQQVWDFALVDAIHKV